jgi:peptidoglycan/LPS O-acetylase OafA/YrhL
VISSLKRAKRLEIQALRAFAVALVVVYHAWPTSVPGGLVGGIRRSASRCPAR